MGSKNKPKIEFKESQLSCLYTKGMLTIPILWRENYKLRKILKKGQSFKVLETVFGKIKSHDFKKLQTKALLSNWGKINKLRIKLTYQQNIVMEIVNDKWDSKDQSLIWI